MKPQSLRARLRLLFLRHFLAFILCLPAIVQGQYAYVTNSGAITITGYTGPGGDLVIPDTINGRAVTTIGEAAFAGNGSIMSVTIPTFAAVLETQAFYGCTNLATVNFPAGLTTIARYAFAGCINLEHVTIPARVTTLGIAAFRLCNKLTRIDVEAGNTTYSSAEGVLFNKTRTQLLRFPTGKGERYQIPATVSNISDGAFYGSRLTEMNIPTNVSRIGAEAFAFSTNLTSIVIPNSVTTLGNSAFLYCTSLTNVTLGTGLTVLPDQTFHTCLGLATLTIPKNIATLGGDTFYDCRELTALIFEGNRPTTTSLIFAPAQTTMVYYLPGTTGWTSSLGGRPSLLWNPKAPTSDSSFGVRANEFGFTITGSSGLIVTVEACTNLASPVWATLRTLTLTNGSAYFSDPEKDKYSARVYRFRSPSGAVQIVWNAAVVPNDGGFGVQQDKFGFTIQGNAGIVVIVEASTNLSPPNWSPISTNTLTGGSVHFTDSQWTNYPFRIYRLRSDQ